MDQERRNIFLNNSHQLYTTKRICRHNTQNHLSSSGK